MLYGIAVLLILLSGWGALGYFLAPSFLPSATIRYIPVTTKAFPGKKLLVDRRIRDQQEYITGTLKLLQQSPFRESDESRYGWIYLNGSLNPKVHSAFLCDREVKEKPLHCVSRIFIEE